MAGSEFRDGRRLDSSGQVGIAVTAGGPEVRTGGAEVDPDMASQLAPLLVSLLAASSLSLGSSQPPPAPGCSLLGSGQAESVTERDLLDRLQRLLGQRLTVKTSGADESYTYHFQLCGSVLEGDQTAGLVQIDNSAMANETKVIGRINATQLIGGSDWILLIYGDGDPYRTHCKGEDRKGLVMISCSWGVVAGGFTVMAEEREKISDCFYLFELDSETACPIQVARLSTGSILLLLFLALVCTYLLGGFLYQRFVLKAKGAEQFPNHSFWQEFGNLTADGCDFVFRSKVRAAPASYRGVGSQPLDEGEDDERDEHLLPM